MITLGLVANVDTDGVYVTMPGSRGVLRGPYEKLQNVAVGDRVLVVTTDDGENVIVGLVADETPRSAPATSTDNTVPRFDGTGGALQTSGVTIADGGAIDGLGYVGAVGPLYLSTGSGTAAQIQFRTNSSARWIVRKSSTAESGSNAGSDFEIRRYDDSGSLQSMITINRATGRITLGDVGTTAGIELGSGGPTITTGTDAPSHSAPDGSLYTRQDGTASTTLYVRAGGAWSALS